MPQITREQIAAALQRMGELALERHFEIRLLAVGGAVMALRFNVRNSTQDVDVVILAPENRQLVRNLAAVVAEEQGWPINWLNEGAKGFLHGPSTPEELLSYPGLQLLTPPVEQLLAMKLAAWRDELDIGDATALLSLLAGSKDDIWQRVEPYLAPGSELKAKYAFDDLWA
jgi:hypothetical protein